MYFLNIKKIFPLVRSIFLVIIQLICILDSKYNLCQRLFFWCSFEWNETDFFHLVILLSCGNLSIIYFIILDLLVILKPWSKHPGGRNLLLQKAGRVSVLQRNYFLTLVLITQKLMLKAKSVSGRAIVKMEGS